MADVIGRNAIVKGSSESTVGKRDPSAN